MKAIEKKMVAAVQGGYNFKESNTEVICNDGEIRVLLFGNEIYRKTPVMVSYNDAGWPTVTTASRLRTLGVNCTHKGRGKNQRIIFE